VIDLTDVTFIYENGCRALDNVSLNIAKGEFVFIIGSSGAGKSSLLKLLTREEVSTSGRVLVNGFNLGRLKRKNIPKFRRSVGMVFQDFRLIKTMNVFNNVAFALRVTGHSNNEIKKQVSHVLKLVQLEEKADMFPNELSGGEQQRVAIARALAMNPPLLVADEPTGNIDPELSLQLVELLRKINDYCGTTVLLVTHEHDVIRYFGGRTIKIENGKINYDDVINESE